MSTVYRGTAVRCTTGRLLKHVAWWSFFLICVFYAAYAFSMAAASVLSLLGIADDAKHRAAPFVFIVHALSGGVALIAGPLQLNRLVLTRKRAFHRAIGRVYVWAIWLSSVAGLWITISFDVSLAAKLAFGVLSILWYITTTIALLHIRRRAVAQHREWMIRSFALSFFFVTGSLWMPGLASTSLPHAIGYPLAVFLSWSLNLIVAEVWIRRTRSLPTPQ